MELLMSKTLKVTFITVMLFALLLCACAKKADQPAAAVEAYWKAMAAKDSAALSSLSCADYEATSVSTLDSFMAVDLVLKDLSCSSTNNTGKTADVTCKGSLTASYGTENFDFDLSSKTFSVTNTNGDWLMCGEK
jgi:hypothetical protein